MRQINPMAKAWANVAKDQRSRARTTISLRKRLKDLADLREGTHVYERTFSDEPVGEQRMMVGREAEELNDKLFKEFLAALDRNVEGRSLERWELVKRFVNHEEK